MLTCLLIGGFLVVMFFATQNAAMVICSNGGERIVLPASASRRTELLAILFAIDGAKLAARKELR